VLIFLFAVSLEFTRKIALEAAQSQLPKLKQIPGKDFLISKKNTPQGCKILLNYKLKSDDTYLFAINFEIEQNEFYDDLSEMVHHMHRAIRYWKAKYVLALLTVPI